METINKCPVCESINTQENHIKVRDTLVTKEMFDLTRCTHCSFILTNPRPCLKNSIKYYKSTEYVSHTDSRRNLKEIVYGKVKKQMQKRKLSWINKHIHSSQSTGAPEKKTLLDYGCGTGDFVLAAQKHGFSGFGYDPAQDAMERARNKGVQSYDKLTDGCLTETQRFDVITMWHVLEHIPNIREVISSCYNSLKKDGILVVAVPMANSPDALIYKESWAAWDAPRHLYHFTPETINKLFQQEKLYCISSHKMPFDAFYISLLSEQNRRANKTNDNNENVGHLSPVDYLRAFRTGLMSNLAARKNNLPSSSQTFIYRKNP